jgi:formate-dependent nitrite reductase membrane component NrfD
MSDGSITAVGTEMRSYYGRPILKEPVWQPEIPWYFLVGGLGGASSMLGLAARATGNEPLAKTGLYVSAAAEGISPVLLISDLGRPERFLNMLRVFKVTSPMSVGSWILAASGATATVAAGLELLGRAPRLKIAAETASAFLGAPLSVYTATLLSDTAIPVWHEARRELPFVFAGSAAASAGAAAAAAVDPVHAAPARRLAVGGVLAGNAAMLAMQARLGMVGEPYHQGEAGKYNAIAKVCTLAGAAVLRSAGRRSRLGAVLGGGLILAGEAALRWSVFKAGFQSARDPKYVVEPQRQRLQRAAT